MLTSRYRADFRVYIEATHALDYSAFDQSTMAEFEEMYQRATRARLAFERAREVLNTHVAAHR